MNVNELNSVANGMVGNGKGILAADESSPTIKKRFDYVICYVRTRFDTRIRCKSATALG